MGAFLLVEGAGVSAATVRCNKNNLCDPQCKIVPQGANVTIIDDVINTF